MYLNSLYAYILNFLGGIVGNSPAASVMSAGHGGMQQQGIRGASPMHGSQVRPDAEPQGMSALPPSSMAMFDASSGSGAPLLSMGNANVPGPNGVLRPPSLGSFQMSLQGALLLLVVCIAA